MIGPLDLLKIGVGVVAGIMAFALVNLVVFLPAAREDGKNKYIAEQALARLKEEQDRKKDDAELQALSDYDLCVRALGRVQACDIFK